MNEQMSLEGVPVPVQREEKTITKIKWTSDFYNLSMTEDDFTDIISGEVQIDDFIIKKMKLHRTIPVNTMGKIFKDEFYKLKKAILNEPVETQATEIEIKELMEPEDQEIEGLQPQEKHNPQAELDKQAIEIIQDLMTREDDLAEYLVNNFKPPVIESIARRLHVEVDELPQKTAWKIAVAMKGLREKQSKGSR